MIKSKNKNLKIWILALVASVGQLVSFAARGCVQPGVAPEFELEPTVVALFGDSITVGRYKPAEFVTPDGQIFQDVCHEGTTDRGAPTRFLNDLFAAEPKRSVIVASWGNGGTNSMQGSENISIHLNANTSLYSYSHENYYVLIMYGTNDFGFGISTTETKWNTQSMISDAIAVGYTPIVGTLTPRSDFEVSSYNSKIKDAASSYGVPVVDHYATFKALNWQDPSLIDWEYDFLGNLIRLHPNYAGYQVIAQNWFDSVLAAAIEPDPVPPIIIAPIISFLLDD